MTKQNHIHKLLVARERCHKEVRKSLSDIPNTFVERRRTYCMAFYKRLRKEFPYER